MTAFINRIKKSNVSFGNNLINTLFWPSLVMMSLLCVVAVSNTVIVGIFVGEKGLSGVNLVFPFYSYANFFGGIIGVGSGLLYFRFLGEREKDRANEIFTQGLFLSIVIGIILFLLMQFGEDLYLNSLDISNEVRAEARAFWEYEKYLIGITPLNYFLLQMIYTNAPINLTANIVSFVSGIGLSILFTKLYGSMGASLGMFIGSGLSILILCIHFFTKKNIFSFRWHFSWKDIIKICKLALVDASKYLDSGLLLTFMNYFIIKNFSESMLPVTSVVLTVFDITVIFDAIGASYTPISEVYLGEGNNYDQKMCARHSFILSIFFGCAFMIIINLVAPYISLLCGVTSPEDVKLATKSIRIFSLAMPFVSMNFMLISQYVIVRKITLAVIYEWVKNFITPLICIIVLGKVIGFNGIWISFIVAEIVSLLGFVLGTRVFAKKKSVFLIKDCEFPIFSQSYIASKQNSISARDDIQNFLLLNKIPKDIVLKVMLLIEESTMNVFEKNKKKVIIQFTVQIHDDEIIIYERDNGVCFKLVDTDAKITDFRQYFYSNLLDLNFRKQYFLTVNYNRNVFTLKK